MSRHNSLADMNLDEQIAFTEAYTRLGKLFDAARDRDRAEMEAAGIYPIYLGITYEGTRTNPEYTVTKWLVDGREKKVRRRVDEHRPD